jgi:hypothetical protein
MVGYRSHQRGASGAIRTLFFFFLQSESLDVDDDDEEDEDDACRISFFFFFLFFDFFFLCVSLSSIFDKLLDPVLIVCSYFFIFFSIS